MIIFIKRSMGISAPSASSVQEAVQDISQSYSGTCEFSASNNMSGITVILEGVNFTGNITFKQVAYVDGQCQISSAMDATASILFTASNSASASSALGVLPWPQADFASAKSFQDMRQHINQASNQQCKVSATNNMTDILVFMENSNFTGNLLFAQEGNSSGKCALSNTMSAAANATGESSNDARSGKKAKGSGSLLGMAGVFIGLIIVVVIITAVIKAFTKKDKKCPKGKVCPEGKKECPLDKCILIPTSATVPSATTLRVAPVIPPTSAPVIAVQRRQIIQEPIPQTFTPPSET